MSERYRMSPDDFLQFCEYGLAMVETLPPDAQISLEQVIEDSGVPYEKFVRVNDRLEKRLSRPGTRERIDAIRADMDAEDQAHRTP